MSRLWGEFSIHVHMYTHRVIFGRGEEVCGASCSMSIIFWGDNSSPPPH